MPKTDLKNQLFNNNLENESNFLVHIFGVPPLIPKIKSTD